MRGGVAAGQGQPERAARLVGAGEGRLTAIGAPVPAAYRDLYMHVVAGVRRVLGEEAYATAFAAGRALSPERAVAEALDDAGAAPGHVQASVSFGGHL